MFIDSEVKDESNEYKPDLINFQNFNNSNETIDRKKNSDHISEHESIYLPSDSSDDNSNAVLIDKNDEFYDKGFIQFKNSQPQSSTNRQESSFNNKLLYINEPTDEEKLGKEEYLAQSSVLGTKVINFGSGFKIPKRSRLLAIT